MFKLILLYIKINDSIILEILRSRVCFVRDE